MDSSILIALLGIPMLSVLGYWSTHRSAQQIRAHRDAWVEALGRLDHCKTHNTTTDATMCGTSIRITHTPRVQGISRANRVSFFWDGAQNGAFRVTSRERLTPPSVPRHTTFLRTGDPRFDEAFCIVTSRAKSSAVLALLTWSVRSNLIQMREATQSRITLDATALTVHDMQSVTSADAFCGVLELGRETVSTLQRGHEEALTKIAESREV